MNEPAEAARDAQNKSSPIQADSEPFMGGGVPLHQEADAPDHPQMDVERAVPKAQEQVLIMATDVDKDLIYKMMLEDGRVPPSIVRGPETLT